MNTSETIFVGLNRQVAALSKNDGQVRWSTKLGGMLGDGFVTLHADLQRVYACAMGQLSCLDAHSGRILWHNELKGFGHGIGSICVPGFSSAPDPATYAKHEAEERSRRSNDA